MAKTTIVQKKPAKSIFRQYPKSAGYFQFQSIAFSLANKPRWLTRFMFKNFFEVEWHDNP